MTDVEQLGKDFDLFGSARVTVCALEPEHGRIGLRQADGRVVTIYEQTWHALITAGAVADAAPPHERTSS